jgi:hypothetical protein
MYNVLLISFLKFLGFGLDVFIELKISIFRILVFRFQDQNLQHLQHF